MVKTVLVCYTQGAFDKLVPTADEDGEADNAPELMAGSREVATLAQKLVTAMQTLQVEAEIVKVPLSSYAARDLSKAAFAWRLLDLSESNGRPIDMLICLDFPAWSVSHPHKICWVLSLPLFVTRQQTARPSLHLATDTKTKQKILNGDSDLYNQTALNINSLLQAERRGLAEARRIWAAQRTVAEELARTGMQLEYNPAPPDDVAPTSETWQKVAQRFLINS